MKRLSKFMLLLMLFFFLITACSNNDQDKQTQDSLDKKIVPVKTLKIEPRSFEEYGKYYGNVTGIKEAALMCVAGGQVEEILVKQGDYVEKGTSLGKIDSLMAKNSYDTAVLNEKIAYEEYLRNKRFFEKGNSSEIKVNQAKLTWLSAKKTLLNAKKLYNGAFCIAPISGTVVSRFCHVHQELSPGFNTFTIAELSKLKIEVGIPESNIQGLKEGDHVEISFVSHPDKNWKGSIFSIGRKVSPGRMTFPVEIHMDNPSKLILSGLVANVKIFKTQQKEKVVVPIQSVLIEDNEPYVMVVNEDLASKRVVKVDYTNKTQMLIKEGLAFGDELIIEGNHLAEDGMPVRIIN